MENLNKPSVDLLPASQNDILVIAELANQIWKAYYPSIITLEQVNFMLQKFYSSDALIEQMNNGQNFYLVNQNSIPIGFIAVTIDKLNQAFINKFYINSNCHQKGIGTTVFNALRQSLPNIHTYTLTVNRQNYKAINFYFKNHFRIKDIVDVPIGNNFVMNDFIMIYTKPN